jgi:hypothetical protein
MKKYFLFLFGIMLLSSSCEDEILDTGDKMVNESDFVLEPYINAFNQYQADDFNLQTGLKSAKSGKKTLTKSIEFKRSTGTFDVVPNMGFCDDILAPLQMVIEGEGIATHLGRFTVKNLACMDWDGTFMSPVYGFITAACGSEIHTMMGIPYPDLENPPNLFYPYRIIGGTEKYQDASGHFLMYGYTDPSTGQWSFTGEGEISY